MITQARLKELLSYDPETGVLTWMVTMARTAMAGNRAGGPSNGGYRSIRVEGKLYREHRIVWFIWFGEFPNGQIDHINGLRTDNRIENLRDVTHQENAKNQKLKVTNTSGITGVSWSKSDKVWRARINIDKKEINLGHYKGLFEACCARKSGDIKYGFHENHGKRL